MRHRPEQWGSRPEVPSFAGQAGWKTPEQPAGFARRGFAALLDLYVVSLLYTIFVVLGTSGARLGAHAAGVEYWSDDLVRALIGPLLALWAAIAWVYIGLFSHLGGQTPGKMALRIRVTRSDGTRLSWIQAVLRPIGYLLSWLPLGLGFAWAAMPPDKRALHDRVLGTRVIRVAPGAPSPVMPTVVIAGLVATACWGVVPASAVVVDRILATANNRVITLSDFRAYHTVFGSADESREAALRALIDRQLLLEEADRFAIPTAAGSDVSARIDALTAQSGGPEAVAERLARAGWDPADLRAWVADDLRVADFLDQRIYFFVLVTAADLDAYYENHREEFSGLSPEDARSAINTRLVQERGDEKRGQFLQRLRAKADIRINPSE